MISSRTKLVISSLFVVLFFTTLIFGIVQTDMAMGSDGQMSSGNCFMPGMMASLCQMNPIEHISTWQNMFTALPGLGDIFVLLLLSLALAFARLLRASSNSASPPKILVLQSQFLFFKRHIPIINMLQEAFSSGILHRKTF